MEEQNTTKCSNEANNTIENFKCIGTIISDMKTDEFIKEQNESIDKKSSDSLKMNSKKLNPVPTDWEQNSEDGKISDIKKEPSVMSDETAQGEPLCSSHRKYLEYVCKEHDVQICADCLIKVHFSCVSNEGVSLVEEQMDKLRNECSRLIEELRNQKDFATELMKERENHQHSVNKKCLQVTTQIEAFRKDINMMLDDKSKQITDLNNEEEESYCKFVDSLADIQETLSTFIVDLKASVSKSYAQLRSSLDKGKIFREKSLNAVMDYANNTKAFDLQFKLNYEPEQTIAEIDSVFGESLRLTVSGKQIFKCLADAGRWGIRPSFTDSDCESPSDCVDCKSSSDCVDCKSSSDCVDCKSSSDFIDTKSNRISSWYENVWLGIPPRKLATQTDNASEINSNFKAKSSEVDHMSTDPCNSDDDNNEYANFPEKNLATYQNMPCKGHKLKKESTNEAEQRGIYGEIDVEILSVIELSDPQSETDIAVISDGRIIVSESCGLAHVLQRDGNYSFQTNELDHPQGITYYEDNKIALTTSSAVLLLEVNASSICKISTLIYGKYYGICYRNGIFAICGDNYVLITSRYGNELNKIQRFGILKKSKLDKPRHVAIDASGKYVYICDEGTQTITCSTVKGAKQWESMIRYGIPKRIVSSDYIFVSVFRFKNIVQLSSSGEELALYNIETGPLGLHISLEGIFFVTSQNIINGNFQAKIGRVLMTTSMVSEC